MSVDSSTPEFSAIDWRMDKLEMAGWRRASVSISSGRASSECDRESLR